MTKALLPDGTISEWDERLRTVGATEILVTSRDIGLAIQGFMEGDDISAFYGADGDEEIEAADRIAFVDVSDPVNLVIELSSGARFAVKIEKLA